MHCKVHPNVSEFLNVCEEFLLRNESEHNLILGKPVGSNSDSSAETNSILVSIQEENNLAGAAVLNPSGRSLLSKMDGAAVRILIDFIEQRKIRIDSIIGPIESTECFVEFWRSSNGPPAKLSLHTGVYELISVRFPKMDNRVLIPTDAVSPNIALQYLLGFLIDCFPDMDDPQTAAAKMFDHHAQARTLFFWKNPGDPVPVCMAAKARESRNAATISLVYTPPTLRRQGHASRMVAALSDRFLKEGKKFCNLFADMANPTSNDIYQEIGYRKIGENKHFKFIQP
jgi:ribosomal protein S18 acetylase RimI-like enzyme